MLRVVRKLKSEFLGLEDDKLKGYVWIALYHRL